MGWGSRGRGRDEGEVEEAEEEAAGLGWTEGGAASPRAVSAHLRGRIGRVGRCCQTAQGSGGTWFFAFCPKRSDEATQDGAVQGGAAKRIQDERDETTKLHGLGRAGQGRVRPHSTAVSRHTRSLSHTHTLTYSHTLFPLSHPHMLPSLHMPPSEAPHDERVGNPIGPEPVPHQQKDAASETHKHRPAQPTKSTEAQEHRDAPRDTGQSTPRTRAHFLQRLLALGSASAPASASRPDATSTMSLPRGAITSRTINHDPSWRELV